MYLPFSAQLFSTAASAGRDSNSSSSLSGTLKIYFGSGPDLTDPDSVFYVLSLGTEEVTGAKVTDAGRTVSVLDTLETGARLEEGRGFYIRQVKTLPASKGTLKYLSLGQKSGPITLTLDCTMGVRRVQSPLLPSGTTSQGQ